MNPINRVGQKVVCIVSVIEWLINVCSKLTNYPKENQVYTVSGFAEDKGGNPAIHLREVPGYDCACFKVTNQPWDIRGFKPYRTTEEDISTFTKILTEKKVNKKVDA